MGNEIEPDRSKDVVATGDAASAPGGDNLEFDQLSAAIRADATDTDSFFRVLASKLADALEGRVQIKREGGLFKRDKPAVGITSTSQPEPGWSSRRHAREAASNARSADRCAGSSSRPNPSRCLSGSTASPAGSRRGGPAERADLGRAARAARVTTTRKTQNTGRPQNPG